MLSGESGCHITISLCNTVTRQKQATCWCGIVGLTERKLSEVLHAVMYCVVSKITGCRFWCSLLKFRDNDETIYDEYRDCAGKLVLAKGGSLAFLGRVKASCDSTHMPMTYRQSIG